MKILSLISSVAILSHLTPGIEALNSNYRCLHKVLGSRTIDNVTADTIRHFKDKLSEKWTPQQEFAKTAIDLQIKDDLGIVDIKIEMVMNYQGKILSMRALALDKVYPCSPTQDAPDFNTPLRPDA
ncbi:BgTH12-02411 [Blumeria graminis f. sp. triticale]|uniref:BgTH12-02411 n=1 Tax=Blumeria graminis f. sp. triticale TaxID=1689686 RepID=A0A9W4D5A0_BLUGR|nr:BgTH12-02411 [Blumeria graminis f. sp. triticale]